VTGVGCWFVLEPAGAGVAGGGCEVGGGCVNTAGIGGGPG
jgi:hypothetical protein